MSLCGCAFIVLRVLRGLIMNQWDHPLKLRYAMGDKGKKSTIEKRRQGASVRFTWRYQASVGEKRQQRRPLRRLKTSVSIAPVSTLISALESDFATI